MKISNKQIELHQKLTFLVNEKKMTQAGISRIARVSTSTLSELLNNKRAFSDKLVSVVLERIKVHAGGTEPSNLVTDVRQYKHIWNITSKCHKEAEMALIVGNTGLGKSATLKEYAQKNKHTTYIKIDRNYTWCQLLNLIATEMGLIDSVGKGKNRDVRKMQTNSVLNLIIQHVEESVDTLCLVIDEAECLSMSVLKQFKNLYTATEGLLGIVMCSIPSIKYKIGKLAGLNEHWMPIKEESNVYSTFARRLKNFTIPKISLDDMRTYCHAKGIKEEGIVSLAYSRWTNYDEANFRIRYALDNDLELSKLTKAQFESIH